MRDLERLLRYEIPGLLIIVYFIVLSYENIKVFGENYGICYEQILRMIPALLAVGVVLALPLGYFAFIFYNFCEEEEFLRRRVGIREGGIVEQILINNLAHTERRWWLRQEDPVVKNEILDIVFYGSNDGNESVPVLERFIDFYHSRKVIGVYVPIIAVILCLVFTVFIGTRIESSILMIFLISSLTFILKPQFLFLLFIVSLITVHPTLEGGTLRRRIDELETNILLSKQREIVEAIARRARRRDDP